jgi:hypothetical protein
MLKKIKEWWRNTLPSKVNKKSKTSDKERNIDYTECSVYNIINNTLKDDKLTYRVLSELELHSHRFNNSTFIDKPELRRVPVINFAIPEGMFDIMLLSDSDPNSSMSCCVSLSEVEIRKCASEIIKGFWGLEPETEDIDRISIILKKYLSK